MALTSFFVPIMAYVQGLPRANDPSPGQVSEQLQQFIAKAREESVSQEIALDRFHEALFPVVAWIDERLSLLPAWRADSQWRVFMLQRKFFNTSLAGVQFFERLNAIPSDDDDLREVFVTCLGLGFVGRYSQNPNSPELMQLWQDNYQLLKGTQTTLDSAASDSLFPQAYRTVTSTPQRSRFRLGQHGATVLAIVLPLLVVVGVAAWFDHSLTAQVAEITRKLP